MLQRRVFNEDNLDSQGLDLMWLWWWWEGGLCAGGVQVQISINFPYNSFH